MLFFILILASKCDLMAAVVVILTPVLTLVSTIAGAGVEDRRLGDRDEMMRIYCYLGAVNSC